MTASLPPATPCGTPPPSPTTRPTQRTTCFAVRGYSGGCRDSTKPQTFIDVLPAALVAAVIDPGQWRRWPLLLAAVVCLVAAALVLAPVPSLEGKLLIQWRSSCSDR